MRGPLKRYNELVAAGTLEADAVQAAAVKKLQGLSSSLTKRRGFIFSRPRPQKGIYLWGGVGRGKSLLMDIFFNNTDVDAKRRVHFHEFMAETHARLNHWRQASDKERRRHKAYDRRAPDDPVPLVGYDLARQAQLLCFDEVQVSDIADAMILGRLFSTLFDNGVTLVATSNRHPDDLYKDGLNRQLFLPAIDMIKSRLTVFELDADRDYRLERLKGAPVYYQPLGPQADNAMDTAWSNLICGASEVSEAVTILGRQVPVPRAARGAARFTFAELCERPLGASDYLAIAARYTTVFVDHIPRMGPHSRNEARRFVNLIDAFYEAKTKLVCSADALPQDLYPAGDGAFEFERTVSRLMEMQTADYLGTEHIALTPETA
ncbi:MAG: cell division protein ZapE [Pseudomonadota bacterium]